MTRPSLMDRLRYRFDNYMSRGTIALIGGLGLLSIIVIGCAALFIWLIGLRPEGAEQSLSFQEAFWQSLMRTMDAGTMGGDTGWGFRVVMFGVTLGGVFIISTLIGVLTSGIEGKMEELRKGRSRVVETGHTVILGWSAQIFSIISELAIANANQKDACIVILAPKDKVEMEDEITDKVGDTGKTRIVCRTGTPIDLTDLGIVNLPGSKSIIALSPESDYPDADVIKTLVGVINRSDRRPEPYHIVAELRDPKNLEVARIVGKDEVEFVLVSDLISRIIAQTCLQSGLSVVYTELLDFGGDEIYFKEEPDLVGVTYGQALMAYRDSAVIGLKPLGDQPSLNPLPDTRLASGDQLIVISQDDDTIHLSEPLEPDHQAIRVQGAAVKQPVRILVLGWNQDAAPILREVDHYVAPGSTVMIVADLPEAQVQATDCCRDAHNISVQFTRKDPSVRDTLEGLDLGSYHRIILLAHSENKQAEALPAQRSDAITLVTLLHLRDLADRKGYEYAIVSQIMDVRNRALAEVTRADDFIVSDKLASLMVAQVAENKYLNAVFVDLFDPQGSEIYLKPAQDYIVLGKPVNFYTVVEAARHRGQTALGYRIKAFSRLADKSYGVVVNPVKSEMVEFAQGDQIIVLGED